MDYTKPLPVIDSLTRGYWMLLKQHKLSVQRCIHCGDRHFPASPVCPVCLSDAQEWEPVSGKASLLTWAVFHRAYWPSFQDDLPYDVCVVRLAEGPLVVANFAGGLPGKVRSGMALQAVFDDVTNEITLPRFAIAEAA